MWKEIEAVLEWEGKWHKADCWRRLDLKSLPNHKQVKSSSGIDKM